MLLIQIFQVPDAIFVGYRVWVDFCSFCSNWMRCCWDNIILNENDFLDLSFMWSYKNNEMMLIFQSHNKVQCSHSNFKVLMIFLWTSGT